MTILPPDGPANRAELETWAERGGQLRWNRGCLVWFLVIAATLILLFGAVVLFLWAGRPAFTEAQADCENAPPVTSYVRTKYWTDWEGDFRERWRISGKMHHYSNSEGSDEWATEQVYDGAGTWYSRNSPTSKWDITKLEHQGSEIDRPFPDGAAGLCPAPGALGAEYEDTDEIGKRYRVESGLTYWTDESGWLLRADRDSPGTKTIISERGKAIEITIPTDVR